MSGYGALFSNDSGRLVITEGAHSYFENPEAPVIISDTKNTFHMDANVGTYWDDIRRKTISHPVREIVVRTYLPDDCPLPSILFVNSATIPYLLDGVIETRTSGYKDNIQYEDDLATDLANSIGDAVNDGLNSIGDAVSGAGNAIGNAADSAWKAVTGGY